jgi:hypothetical protein
MYRPDRTCWLCGKNGCGEPLDKHHIFGGVAYRKKSERYGLTVFLCHDSCHENGPESVHRNPETRQRLQEYGQRRAMEENGWTVEDFIREFGKNHLSGGEEDGREGDTREVLPVLRRETVRASERRGFELDPLFLLPY